MSKIDTNKIVAAIDIGTTKICALIAKLDEFGKLHILGMGRAESDGVKDGSILNIDKTIVAIKEAIKAASDKAGADISLVNVGFAGRAIKSSFNNLSLTIESRDGIITKNDLRKLTNDAHRVVTEPGYEIIHVIPQLYKVDSKHVTKDPVGIHGVKLECDFHVITASSVDLRSIKKCIESSDLVIDQTILEPLASSMSVLSEEEKEIGVAIVDIGGGTTDLAIFHSGMIRHTCVIPFGGNIISGDVKEGLSVTTSQAETLKIKFGRCLADEIDDNLYVSIPGIRERTPKEISIKNLSSIIDARVEEIADWVALEIEKSNFGKKLQAGIVITGGGALLKNVEKLFAMRTGLDIRVGYPNEYLGKGCDEEVKKPMYATTIGLLLAGFKPIDERLDLEQTAAQTSQIVENDKSKEDKSDPLSKLFKVAKGFFIDDFQDKNH